MELQGWRLSQDNAWYNFGAGVFWSEHPDLGPGAAFSSLLSLLDFQTVRC